MLEATIYKWRGWIALSLVAITFASSSRHIGNASDFYLTFVGHALFGQALYCYAANKIMVLGGAIATDAPIAMRRFGAGFAALGFVLMGFAA